MADGKKLVLTRNNSKMDRWVVGAKDPEENDYIPPYPVGIQPFHNRSGSSAGTLK